MQNRRAKLPLEVRRKVQVFFRYFAFFAITFVTLWQFYVTLNEFRKVNGNVMKSFGFVPGII
jgi:hypothetical protein